MDRVIQARPCQYLIWWKNHFVWLACYSPVDVSQCAIRIFFLGGGRGEEGLHQYYTVDSHSGGSLLWPLGSIATKQGGLQFEFVHLIVLSFVQHFPLPLTECHLIDLRPFFQCVKVILRSFACQFTKYALNAIPQVIYQNIEQVDTELLMTSFWARSSKHLCSYFIVFLVGLWFHSLFVIISWESVSKNLARMRYIISTALHTSTKPITLEENHSDLRACLALDKSTEAASYHLAIL